MSGIFIKVRDTKERTLPIQTGSFIGMYFYGVHKKKTYTGLASPYISNKRILLKFDAKLWNCRPSQDGIF
jgi:hypothetical protein